MDNIKFLAARGWELKCVIRSRVVEGLFEDVLFYQEQPLGKRQPEWEFWKEEKLLLEGTGDTVDVGYDCLMPFLSKQDLLFELPFFKRYSMYDLDDLWENKVTERMSQKWKG